MPICSSGSSALGRSFESLFASGDLCTFGDPPGYRSPLCALRERRPHQLTRGPWLRGRVHRVPTSSPLRSPSGHGCARWGSNPTSIGLSSRRQPQLTSRARSSRGWDRTSDLSVNSRTPYHLATLKCRAVGESRTRVYRVRAGHRCCWITTAIGAGGGNRTRLVGLEDRVLTLSNACKCQRASR